MAEFKPFEMIMRIEHGGAVVDGDVMQVCMKANPVKELVRCGECEHWQTDRAESWCELRPREEHDPSWFCADGERREG